MSLSGDFAKLADLTSKFKRAAGTTAAATIARDLGDFSAKAVVRSFAGQQSPEGAGWADGPYFKGLRGPTGKLRGSFVLRAGGRGFTLRNRARYAHYHQHGAALRGARKKMSGPLKKGRHRKMVRGSGNVRGQLPARPILPGDSIPGRWLGPYNQITDRAMSRIFGG
jgi:phage gpG-like protein